MDALKPPKHNDPKTGLVIAKENAPRARKLSAAATERMMDEIGIGSNARVAFEFIRDVMQGKVLDPAGNGYLYVPIKDRIDAAIWLAEKRTGKAVAQVAVDHDHEHHHEIDLGALKAADLDLLEDALRRAEIVDGEVVPRRLPRGEPEPEGGQS